MLPEDIDNKLYEFISQAYFHDKNRRELHRFAGTYEDIVIGVSTWIKDTQSPSRFLHITGPIAIGKSSIVKIISARSNHPVTSLAGDHFFWYRRPQRTTLSYLPAAFASRLGSLTDETCEHITKTFWEHPDILHASIEVQWQKLIVESLESIKFPLSFRPAFYVDGLDECRLLEDQTWVLEKLVELCVRFPVVVVTSSREGPYISKELSRLESIYPTLFHSPIVLQETAQNNISAMKILHFTYSFLVPASQDEDHPNTQRIKRVWQWLIDNAAGQYWIIKLLTDHVFSAGGDGSLTVEKLEATVYSEEIQAQAYFPLDERYDHFMSTMDLNEQQAVIRNELLYHLLYLRLDSIADIATFWNHPLDQLSHVLDYMHPVLRIPAMQGSEPITFYFPSFRSFLSSSLRGGDGHRHCISSTSLSIRAFERSIAIAQQRDRVPPNLVSLWLVIGSHIDISTLNQASRRHVIRLLADFDFLAWIHNWYPSLTQNPAAEYGDFCRWASQLGISSINAKFNNSALSHSDKTPGKLKRLYRKLFPKRHNSQKP